GVRLAVSELQGVERHQLGVGLGERIVVEEQGEALPRGDRKMIAALLTDPVAAEGSAPLLGCPAPRTGLRFHTRAVFAHVCPCPFAPALRGGPAVPITGPGAW